MLILRGLRVLGCLTAMATKINLKLVAFPRSVSPQKICNSLSGLAVGLAAARRRPIRSEAESAPAKAIAGFLRAGGRVTA
jgi:hypothetical protein